MCISLLEIRPIEMDYEKSLSTVGSVPLRIATGAGKCTEPKLQKSFLQRSR